MYLYVCAWIILAQLSKDLRGGVNTLLLQLCIKTFRGCALCNYCINRRKYQANDQTTRSFQSFAYPVINVYDPILSRRGFLLHLYFESELLTCLNGLF